MFNNLERHLQLHERLEVIYVVDGYEAQFFEKDGDKMIAAMTGETILAALNNLDSLLGTKISRVERQFNGRQK